MKQDRLKLGRALAACVTAIAVVCTLGGCRASDALKEIVYLQTADTVDYDNPNKYYINDSTADETSDQVSADETSNDAASTDTEQNLVVYSSDPNTKDYTAKQSIFSNKPDFEGIEASEKVFFYKSNDKDAIDHTVTKEEDKDEKNKKDDETVEPNKSGGSTVVNQADDSGAGGKGKNKAQSDKNNSSGGLSEDEAAGKKARKLDPSRVASDNSNPTEEPETAAKVAAYGAYATIVQMIAGEGALVATDAKTLSSDFSKVFNTKGIAKGWSDGGSAKNMNVDAIIKSGATQIITSDASYLTKVSDAAFGKLSKAGIKISVLRPMTCSKYIKDNVTTVAKIFKGTTSGKYAAAGKTIDRANAYKQFHDRVLKACVSANGGSYAGDKVYQSNGKADDVGGKGTSASDSTYTLLVSAYDEKASYKGASLGKKNWKPANGLAYALAGCSTSPVSYYIQCGGLLNNAAATTSTKSSGYVPIWQFNNGVFGFSAKNWSGITVSLLDDTAIANMGHVLLDTGLNRQNIGLGSGFGSSKFPKLIAATSKIKRQLIANSKKSNGMYTPYKWVTASESGGVTDGFGCNIGGQVLYSCMGSDGSKSKGDGVENLLGNSIPSSSIAVNPKGLFSDWTQGTVESFLEAAWVSDEVNSNANGVDWKQEAADFYKEFYDYDLNANQLEQD